MFSCYNIDIFKISKFMNIYEIINYRDILKPYGVDPSGFFIIKKIMDSYMCIHKINDSFSLVVFVNDDPKILCEINEIYSNIIYKETLNKLKKLYYIIKKFDHLDRILLVPVYTFYQKNYFKVIDYKNLQLATLYYGNMFNKDIIKIISKFI